MLLLFGSGDYRRSDVRLACRPEGGLDRPGPMRYLAGVGPSGRPVWSEREDDAAPLFRHPCVGELSVSWNEYLGR